MRELGMFIFFLFSCACTKIPEGRDAETCEDEKDNDQDGKIDCEDDGCMVSAACIELARLRSQIGPRTAEKATRQTAADAAKWAQPLNPELEPVFEIGPLMVESAENGKDLNWSEAESYCSGLNLLGHTDWRLPDMNEAVKIVESGRLKGETSYVMWTSTQKGPNQAVIVGKSGAVNDLGIQYRGQCRARCVRGAVAK